MQEYFSSQPAQAYEWPENYFDSSERFKRLAFLAKADIDTFPIAALGPNNETLHIDIASFTAQDDEHRIIITSGLHGVEGPLGAAVQFQCMKSLAEMALPEKTGIIFIHAVNPWGYAHLRRVDENNIDMNRNFFDRPPPESPSKPMYAKLDALINTRKALSRLGEIFHWAKAIKTIVSNGGIKPLFGPIAQGQHDHPKGLFYGGQQSGEACLILQDLVRSYTLNAKRVSVLDVHTGLGPSSVATLIGHCNFNNYQQDTAPANTQRKKQGNLQWLSEYMQKSVVSDNDDNNAYNAQGTFARWCHRTLAHKQLVYLCVEVGTLNPISVFSALRRENQAHHWNDPNSKAYEKTKRRLFQTFSPTSIQWRANSIDQVMDIVNRTISLPSRIQL